MVKRTSTELVVGEVYTRERLRELFGITDATLNNGIFKPKNTQSVWLFVTEEKTSDRVQYKDHLDGDVLLMQGQTEGRTDHLLTAQVVNGLELLVFHRMKKYEHEGAGFRYQGPFHYIRSFGSRPKSFVLMRDTGRVFRYGRQTWRWALEAVQQLGGRATSGEIETYILERVPEFKVSNISPDLRLITVNEYGRSAWDVNRMPRRTDGSNPIDALFRQNEAGKVYFEVYEPSASIHGVWELAANDEGVLRPYLVGDVPEVAVVLNELQTAGEFDPTNEIDGRKRVFASIARRQGQPKFRRELLAAYGERCAVTGCPLQAILEGAHIRPYRGGHTNHVTNGILLRADIHTLFDLGLLRVNPLSWIIEVAVQARCAYGGHHGQLFQLPEREWLRPDVEAIRLHYEDCSKYF